MTEKICKRCGKTLEFYQEDKETTDYICRDCEILVRIKKKYME